MLNLNDIMSFKFLALLLLLTPITGVFAENIFIKDAQLSLIDDIHVASRDAGVIETVDVRAGDEVSEYSVLLQLDQSTQRTAVAGAKAQWEIAKEEAQNDVNVRFAKKSVEVAADELRRSRQARHRFAGAVSGSEIQRQELELEQAILSGEQAIHEMKINRLTELLRASEHDEAMLRLQHRMIRSPRSGVVSEIMVQKGEWVDRGATVARVVNLDKLRIVALVPKEYLHFVSNDQEATLVLTIESKTTEVRGNVSFVSPDINPVNGEFLVWVDIDNSARKLRPGLVGTLRLNLSERVAVANSR